ncbi:hypothetical protein ABB37_08491 [Leptomonas pyrrhocoris]|uniref:Uncharacterized protein n=1 Tax=Leptomonas pyrrhocoris TaxID=157538 RepID=A0A0N0VDH9_LEPPY|nr:hypothetical protein ABB37_08491 [Leptomonas pyrrhocoris]KPA75624.1 hypothetical protein ABB37_08491 [Leptomonas pyrrhocoris]|eukprot:XP_015654063.1 hypothetical protein ABB37_08491 [Leptomonas pyrrhocoris]
MMPFLELSSSNTVCWRPGKLGYVDVVAPLLLTEATQPAPAMDGIATPIALACIKQPKQELTLWLSWKGHRDFQKAPKAFHSVLHVCTEGAVLGFFYTQHSGGDLAFALIEHAKGDVEKLLGSPRNYAVEVEALINDIAPEEERKMRRQRAKKGACFVVHQATLRHTTRGFVVAAVISVDGGDLYGIVGDLEANVWRKSKLRTGMADAGSTFCVFISATGAEVRFVRCDVEAPADPYAATVAPNVSLALSAFERVSTADAVAAADGSGGAAFPAASPSPPRVVCAVVHESIFPTRASKPVTVRCYQSHAFPRTAGEEVTPYRCLSVVEDKSVPVYTIVVVGQVSSYVVHASYARGGGGRLVSSANVVPELQHPISVCSLRVPTHPLRRAGTTLSLLLCRDMKLYACEHFGKPAAVALRINNLLSTVVTFPFPPQLRPSKRQAAFASALDAATDAARLIAVRGGTEVMCTNGVVGVFFHVSTASLAPTAPAVTKDMIAADATDPFASENGVGGEDGGDGAAALRQCLAKLKELSLRTTRHDMPDVVFREVVPFLRDVGTAQQEVMLVQRVYEELLRMTEPNLQSEWNYLWSLTSVVQETLARRSKENGVLYTDAFFLQLADAYRNSEFASQEGMKVVGDAVRAVVSDEAAQVLTAQPTHLPLEVHYVLDGLAEGVSPIDLAEEIARRMVHTSTLSNGACVVSAPLGKAECVHCMGCVLLASCLDLNVFACAQEGRELRVCMQPTVAPENEDKTATTAAPGTTCVGVPPCTFQTQDEFEKALTLAADLLCVSTADASFRPDVALLSLAIGTRQHCLTAFVQLFAPVLRSAVEDVSPLANNTAWIEACTVALSRGVEEQATALLIDERSSGRSLSTTLVYVLYAPQRTFNIAFFRVLAVTLPEEFCTAALVACVFHQTEHLVAAVHNYAAAVAKYVLGKTDSHREGGWQAVQVGKKRLHAALTQTYALWAHMGTLSPYSVRDVATSYRMSIRNSLAPSPAAQAARGTVVSRTLVVCFRLLCLVQFCCDAEGVMEEGAQQQQQVMDGVGGVRSERCTEALQALYLVRESPLPLEWFQRSFVSLVQHVADTAPQPTWTPYLVRLLQLSNVRQTGNARLKKEFYRVLDALQAANAPQPNAEVTNEASEGAQRAIAAAESAVTALTLLEEVSGSGRSAPSATTVHFVFSATRDPSLPRWTSPHAVPEQRYLFSHEWTEVLWTLERMPVSLLAACERVAARVAQLAAPANNDDAAAPSLSMEMASPLFAHLCRLRPPVRVHALPTHSTAASTANADVASAVQRQPRPTSPAETPTAATATTAAANAMPTAASAVVMTSTAASPTHAVAPAFLAPTGINSPVPPRDRIEEAAAHPGLYGPADVAWWDSVGLPASTSRASPHAPGTLTPSAEVKDTTAINTTAGEDNGESSDTATSYTTSTSNYADPIAALDEFGRRRGRPCKDRRRTVGSNSSSNDSDSSRADESRTLCCDRRRGASLRSPPLSRCHRKKKCHCCHRAAYRHNRHQSCSRRKEKSTSDDEMAFSLKWKDFPLETEVAPLRPPPTRAPATARPTLLSFTTRLQPPEEPSRSFAQTARTSSQGRPPIAASTAAAADERGPRQVTLLRLPTSSTAPQGPSRVHLYTLHGERVEAADGGDVRALHRADTSRGVLLGSAAPLAAPAVPPGSVFVAPPALLRLPQQGSSPQGAASPEVTGTMAPPYPQAARVPAGPAPPAVDLSTLQNPSAPVQQQQQQRHSEAPPMLEAARQGAPTPLPVPVPPPAAPAGVLNPSQLADFHRYTDGLLARQAGPAVGQTESAAAATTPLPDAPSPADVRVTTAAEEGPADCPGVSRLVLQQEDFIRKAEALMQTRQAENEGFYRRVVESIRSLTAASQQLRGLTPVEQSQLVRDTVKQRNELMGLNHQLLEIQLAAARVSGEMPTPPLQTPTSVPTPASVAAPVARSSVGVSWAAPAATPSLTSVPTQTPAAPKIGMQEALSDLQRLNTELMGVSASADAMDKAIKETRDVIQRYEQTKTAEALTAEGVALTAAMRMRTAAIEQRLTELPRRTPQPTSQAPSSSPASHVWTVQSSSVLDAESGETKPSGRGASTYEQRPTPTNGLQTTTATTPPPAYNPQFTAMTETTDLGDGGEVANTPHLPTEPQPQLPLPAAPAFPSVAIANSPATPLPSSSSPSPLPAASRTPPAFTTVSSAVLECPAAGPSAVNEGVNIDAAPRRVRTAPTQHTAAAVSYLPHRSESAHARSRNEGERPPAVPPAQARVYAKPSDLRSLFVEAGGVAHAGAHTPPNASARLRSAAPSSVGHPSTWVPKSAAAQRSTANATGVRHTPAGGRYAMYRTPAQQPKRSVAPPTGFSSCLPLSYSQSSGHVGGAPHIAPAVTQNLAVAAGRASVGNAYTDRQRDRRLSSIARRIQQLEHDLFD